MAFTFSKDKRNDRLYKRAETVTSRIEDLRVEIEHSEKLLDLCTHPGWEQLCSTVLEGELNHIAREAIKVDSEDLPNRYRAEGSYDKVTDLFRRKDVLQAEIDEMRIGLSRLHAERDEVQEKIKKAQE